ncbi:MAG: hypothetical protein WAQ28_21055 [Bacteroidia bacterium]
MNLRLYVCLFLLSFFYEARSQSALDTMRLSLQQKPQLFGKLDTRNSFISNSRAKIFGCKLGLDFANKLHFGLGYNQLYPPAKDFDEKIYFNTPTGLTDSSIASLKLFYISTHAEYAYYQTGNWNMSILLQIGAGKTYYQYLQNSQKIRTNESFIFIYEPAISVEYKLIKWVGLGVDAGFRFMIADYRKINGKFNSPTYAFKLLIYYNEIYKSVLKEIKKKA